MSTRRHTVVFANVLGGVGQTTLLANLAYLMASQGVPCLALELSAQNSLAQHLGLEQPPAEGWATRFASNDWVGDAMLANEAGVQCLPFGAATPTQTDSLHWRLRSQTTWLDQQLEELELPTGTWVLIDSPPWPTQLARQALHCADQVVLTLEASPRALQVAERVRLLRAGAPAEAALGLVVDRFDPRRPTQGRCLSALEQRWGAALAPHLVHEDEANPAALEQAACVCAVAPQAQSAHDMNGLLQWLQSRAEPAQGALQA